MDFVIRDATTADIADCIKIRGLTSQNPLTVQDLQKLGVTENQWKSAVEQNKTVGTVCEVEAHIVGYCFGEIETGEILVLALLPEYENKGIGKILLLNVMDKLFAAGHEKLWLAASPDPAIRAHGFYRHLGWEPSGVIDEQEDEILEHKRVIFGEHG